MVLSNCAMTLDSSIGPCALLAGFLAGSTILRLQAVVVGIAFFLACTSYLYLRLDGHYRINWAGCFLVLLVGWVG